MKPNPVHLLLSSMLGMAAILPSRETHAESPSADSSAAGATAVENAQRFFDMAMALMAEGKAGRACRLFEASLRLDPAMGTQYRLAECHEHIGKLALAWSNFTAIVVEAKQLGHAEREKIARERADALRPRIGRVTIMIPAQRSEIPALDISFDGALLRPGRWIGGANLVEAADPGIHVLEARAPGRIPWRRVVRVDAGTMIGVTVPGLAKAARCLGQICNGKGG